MSKKINARRIATMVALFCSLSTAALADPPARVGRVSDVEGPVSFHAADQDEWSGADLNYPVTTGDAFWTEPQSRSELQIGGAEVRMDSATELNVVQLDDDATRLDVPQGTVNLHLSAAPVGDGIHVTTPSAEVDLVEPGTYHIDSGHPVGDAPAGQTQVTVLEGQLQIKGPRSMLEVMPGETAVISGDGSGFSLQEGNATPFDDWALAREKREAEAQAVRYVSPRMTGFEDLDRYGQWSSDADYGTVWYPAGVSADWAPYRYGHWVFVQPWGWTWVDDAPWGFAPFHYGRWVQNGPRWGWVPGERVDRPVYAPALVAFIGGAGWSVSLSGRETQPAVGWVPLAPREAFHPYYAVSAAYVRHVNITNVGKTAINDAENIREARYANQQAASVVPAASFTRGAPVHGSLMPVSRAQIEQAPVTPTVTHLQPARERTETPARRLPQQPVENRVPQEPASPARQPEIQAHVPPAAVAPERRMQGRQTPSQALVQARPPVRHPAPAAAAAARPSLPRAAVPHPEQKTRITPTPQGWKRAAGAQAPAPRAPAQPPNAPDNRRPEREER